MFKVWAICKERCAGWEMPRVLFEEEDPVQAIRLANIARDELHETWIEEVSNE